LVVLGHELKPNYIVTKMRYEINVITNEKEYKIKRTYQEIKELYDKISKIYEIPPIPPPLNIFNVKSKSKINSTIEKFQTFFETMLGVKGATKTKHFTSFCVPKKHDLLENGQNGQNDKF